MKRLPYLFLLIPFILLCCSSPRPASAQGEWRFIADKIADFGLDHDVIHLGDVRDDFRQLRLRVTDAPLKMLDMKIYFDNGSVQDVPLRAFFRKGEESRIIDLNGGLRHLKKIEFWYETAGRRKGRSRVAVWGHR
jgi:hypothetical protein